jgi:hypothetical protein
MDNPEQIGAQGVDADALDAQMQRDLRAALASLRWQIIAFQAHLDQLAAALLEPDSRWPEGERHTG